MGFDGSQLLSNYFTLKLKGHSQLKEQVGSSPLKGEICIIPSPELESLDGNLMGVYILAGGVAGGELCIKVSGQLLKPNFEKQNTGTPGRELPQEDANPQTEQLESPLNTESKRDP